MAQPTYGVTFMPQGDALYKPGGAGRQGSAPVQEAVKVLSLRVPNVLGANPLAPLALLTAPGSGEVPAGLLQQLLRQQGLMGTPPSPTAVSPAAPMPQMAPAPAPAAPVSAPAPPPVPQPTVAAPASQGPVDAPPAPAPIGAATPLPSPQAPTQPVQPIAPQPPQLPQEQPPVPGWVRYGDGWVPPDHPLVTGSWGPVVRPTVTGAQTSAPLQPAIPTLPMQPNQPAPSLPPPRVTPGTLPGQPGPTPLPAPVPPAPEPPPIVASLPNAGLGPETPEEDSWRVVQALLKKLRGEM